jgi:hypothetical protein
MLIGFSLLSWHCKKPNPFEPIITNNYPVMINGILVSSTGFGMGVNSSSSLTDWTKQDQSSMEMDYPGNLGWGAVFITVGGDPVSQPQYSIDISNCSELSVEMKGALGGEGVLIGIKDITDPNDGSETKIPVVLTQNWNTYYFKLTDFNTCNLTQVYVVTEFVFPSVSNQAETIYVNNITILK